MLSSYQSTPWRALFSQATDKHLCHSPYLTSCFQFFDSTAPILTSILVYRLFLHISTNVSWDMPCGHWTDILRKCSMKLLTVSSYFCLVAKKEWIDTSGSSSNKWLRNSLSTSNQALIVLGENCINQVKADPHRILAKIFVVAGSLPIKWKVWERKYYICWFGDPFHHMTLPSRVYTLLKFVQTPTLSGRVS